MHRVAFSVDDLDDALEIAASHGCHPLRGVAKLRSGPETPNGFYLRRLEDGLWLRGYESGPENIYPPGFTDFVFMHADQPPNLSDRT